MPLASSRRLLALTCVALSLSVLAVAKESLAQEVTRQPLQEPTLTVTGWASIDVEPDIAIIRAGAVTDAQTARAAMEANTKIMQDAFTALDAAGVEARDMQPSRLTVEPRYTYFDSSNGERRPPRIDGYTVSNQLTVRVRDLATIGEALDALIDAGVNQMGGLSFTVDEPQAAIRQAQQDAVRDAREQAELLTDAAGVNLGRIISITPQGQGGRPQPPTPQFARMAMDAAAESVPIATGEQEIEARVTIVWALNQ